MDINQIDRLARAARYMDEHAIRGIGGVQRGQGPCHRRLPLLLQHAVEVARPMDITLGCHSQAVDAHALQCQIIARLGIEHTINEHQLEPIHIRKAVGLIIVEKKRRARSLDLHKAVGAGEFPVFIAPIRQAHNLHTRQRCLSRGRRPQSPLRQGHRPQPRLKRCLLCLRLRHHATSARISA